MRKGAILLWLVLPALLVLLLVLASAHDPYPFKLTAQRSWIITAANELTSGPPPPELAPGQEWYKIPGYLIFSNGWAAYRVQTSHGCDGVGNVGLLRSSTGNLYLTHMHFCTGITEEIRTKTGDEPARPADIMDFLEHHASVQQWRLVNQRNDIWCMVNTPKEDLLPKDHIWFWISKTDGTNRTTLCEYRYTLTTTYPTWNSRWLSDDTLVVDLYDHLGYNPRRNPEIIADSNHLVSFIFQRDLKSGRFHRVER